MPPFTDYVLFCHHTLNKNLESQTHRLTDKRSGQDHTDHRRIVVCHNMRPQYLQTATKFAGGVLCYAIGAGIYDKFFKTEAKPTTQGRGIKVV
jgi:hypothetical protein